jgi:threonyl-tRNA synthetase
LAERIIIAKVNNQQLWDLNRPLEASCSLSLLDFDSPDNNYEARQVFWHSSAHVLGEACERRYDGCCLGYGPPLEEGGFFYDMSLAENRAITMDDWKPIEDVCKIAVKEKQPFERLELPKEVLLEMFKVSCCFRTQPQLTAVQQVQAALHQRQGSGRHVLHGVPLRTAYRPVSWSACPPHRPNQVVGRDEELVSVLPR